MPSEGRKENGDVTAARTPARCQCQPILLPSLRSAERGVGAFFFCLIILASGTLFYPFPVRRLAPKGGLSGGTLDPPSPPEKLHTTKGVGSEEGNMTRE